MDANRDGEMDILLVDDHVPIRHEMRQLIEAETDLNVAGETNNGREAVQFVRDHRPDLILMDILMPGMNGIEASKAILADFPKTRILVLSNLGGRNLVRLVLDLGACGYVRKDRAVEELTEALETICRGDQYLGEGLTD